MEKDWIGNKKTLGVTLGASNHSQGKREKNDFYATPPLAVSLLMANENWDKNTFIWEPACGEGHISKELKRLGYLVESSDLINRGYGKVDNFLTNIERSHNINILTNPPFKYALEFVKQSLSKVEEGNKVAMLLRLQFLEGIERGKFFKTCPPKTVYVFSKRINCAMNGKFENYGNGGAVAYCWCVWEKNYNKETTIKWIN